MKVISSYPLLGPRFMGTRLKEHFVPTRLQLEHRSTPDSEVASQRIYRSLSRRARRIISEEVKGGGK